MKDLYNGSLERKADGTFVVIDRKVKYEEMSEIELVLYLGSLLGSYVETMRRTKKVCSLYLKLMYEEENLLNN